MEIQEMGEPAEMPGLHHEAKEQGKWAGPGRLQMFVP